MGFAQNYGECATLIVRKDGREQEFQLDDGVEVTLDDMKKVARVLFLTQQVTGTRVLDHNGKIVAGYGELR